MLELQLIGNATEDHITEVMDAQQEWQPLNRKEVRKLTRFGGIWNMFRVLNGKMNLDMVGRVGDDQTGYDMIKAATKLGIMGLRVVCGKTATAEIECNITTGENTGPAEWGVSISCMESVDQARWSHIAYLNVLQELPMNIIRGHSVTVSADLCDEGLDLGTFSKHLHDIDILFCTHKQKEQYMLDVNVGQKIIAHSPDKITVYNHGTEPWEFVPQRVPGINTLGAGDTFAAWYIYYSQGDFVFPEDQVVYQACLATSRSLEDLHEKV